ncbi:histone-binding protein RBBP4 or subunit C of CAF1 complex-domain-containing protein [Russula compacta]|nr:histone-binding protein RBBP4 or subunit C of CAF1 complex-domain-containing protein [Russula compacta]
MVLMAVRYFLCSTSFSMRRTKRKSSASTRSNESSRRNDRSGVRWMMVTLSPSLRIEESDEKPQAPSVFIPGLHTLGKDEVLEADESVYIVRHTMRTTWPCLSFDVLRDDGGDQRQQFPMNACIITGTQADTAKNNNLSVFKMMQLHKTQKVTTWNDNTADLRS